MRKEWKKYLGIDWGEKRIGLALADSETGFAMPFKVAESFDEIIKVIKDEEIDVVAIGKPVSIMNYELRIKNKEYNNFVSKLKKVPKISIKFIDERLTSKAADALEGNKKTKAPRDAIAAMIILQSYLDKKCKENAANK